MFQFGRFRGLVGAIQDGLHFSFLFVETVLPDSVYFLTKNPNLVNFRRSCNGRCWYFYCHSVYFTAKWCILWPFGKFSGHLVYFSPVLVCCAEKNLATLVETVDLEQQCLPLKN
jgi:hypothetical protein